MKAFIILCLVAVAVAMPYGPVLDAGWGAPAIAHAPAVAYAHAPAVAYAHAPAVAYAHAPAYAQPVVKQFVQPQYVHAAPVIKAVAPAASSYATFSQVHVSHPQPIVKHVVAQPVYAQPIVKQVVAQPVYAQPYVKQVVAQPVYAQPFVKQVVAAQPVYAAHNPW